MFLTRLAVSLFEFALAVLMAGVVIGITYHVFIRANPDFDMETEIKKGNTAVGALVASILYAASTMLMRGMDAVVGLFRLHMGGPSEGGWALWQLALMGLGHLVFSMVLAVFTISLTLRLFGRLTRRVEEGKELQKGNLAVGLVLSSVVIVVSLYVGEGVSALSKALVPQPSIGRIQISH